MPEDETIETARALSRVQTLKAEHRPILDALAGDAGMAPATRQLLIDHLLEEEDEHIAVLAGLVRAGQPLLAQRGGTVGSLRREPAHAAPARGTVGSLRR